MLSPVVLPIPAALAIIAALAAVLYRLEHADQFLDAVDRLLARLTAPVLWSDATPAPARAETPVIAKAYVTLPLPEARPTPVIPGRHRLENALDFPGPPYRPQAWPAQTRPFVGILDPIAARPFISAPVSAPPVAWLDPADRVTLLPLNEDTGDLAAVR
jgi:hypothetical protein